MHVPLRLLDAVARGEEPRETLEELVMEHLAGLCPPCADRLAAHEARLRRPGHDLAEEPRDSMARLKARLGLREVELRAHEEKARAWVRDVVKLAREERRDKVFNAYVRFKGPLFCLLLLDEARSRMPRDPTETLSLADAVLASNRKTALYHPDPEIEAPALAVRGNARRAMGQLLDAESDLEEARRLLDSSGVTDPATPAELYSYLGSLRKDQGRYEEAARYLDRSALLYRLLRDRESAAHVKLILGTLHYRRHEAGAAVAADEEALRLLPHDSKDWLRGYAHYNLAFHLHAYGDTDRAEAELAAHQELITDSGPQLANLLVWLRARIAWSRSDLSTAESLYTEARQRALDRGIAWDAGLVGLELALVHLVQGRTAKVRKLAAEAHRIFAEQEVEREARAALELMEAAARRDALTREILERTVAALEGVSHAPPSPSPRDS